MNIRTRIMLAAMMVIVIVSVVYSYYVIDKERDLAMTRLNSTIEESARLLKVVMAGPLYDGNIPQLTENILSFFKNPDIISISLKEYNGDISISQQRDQVEDVGEKIISKVVINRGIDDLGEVNVVYSTALIEQRLTRSKNELAVFTLILMTLVMLVILYIAKGLSKPIENLTLAARKMANGDLDQSISLQGAEELVVLAQSFLKMRDSIRDKIDDLADKNKRLNLEIREHMHTQRALQESEQKYRTLFEKTKTPMMLIKGRRFIDGNRALLEMLGLDSVEELRQMTLDDISPEFQPDGTPSIKYLVERGNMLSSIGNSYSFETYHQRKNGELFPVAVSATVVSIEGEQIKHAIWQDISARKKAESELQTYRVQLEDLVRERTNELEAVNKELEAFSYSVSHDLRAPLRAIDGFSQALLEDYGEQLDDVGKDFLKRVRAGAQNMAALIDSMLQLSRMNRVEMHIEEVDLSQMARDIFDVMQKSGADRKVNIQIQPEMKAQGDRGLLRILLENLLCNAWKYSSKKELAEIEFGCHTDRNPEEFYVRDNGAGFDMRYNDKLFGAFQRLHDGNEFEGTGIGLATVQRVIARHHGKVWAEAEINKGATFYFSLAVNSSNNDKATIFSSDMNIDSLETSR